MNRRVLAPTAATKEDVSALYRTTMTEARRSDGESDVQGDWINVDLLEATAFEEWVLGELAQAGYDTRRTPRSGDCGADGLAIFATEGNRHTVVVQCKHTQPDAMCGRTAVEEVLRSITATAYENAIVGEPRPMVVTNAAGFTNDAMLLAKREGVRLIARGRLPQLRTVIE